VKIAGSRVPLTFLYRYFQGEFIPFIWFSAFSYPHQHVSLSVIEICRVNMNACSHGITVTVASTFFALFPSVTQQAASEPVHDFTAALEPPGHWL
jgi:hypothetical protein